MTTLPATSELVTVAFIKNAPGITSGQVATTLPDDNTTWATSGFIQVGPVVGGQPDMYYARRAPVIQVSCWANNPSSNQVPWGKANYLAELITNFMYDFSGMKAELTLPGIYASARVNSARLLTEFRRVPDTEGDYARYDADLEVAWVQTEATVL